MLIDRSSMPASVNAFEWSDDADQMDWLKRICREGWIAETGTPKVHHESTKWTRIGAGEVVAKPDGISLHGPTMEVYRDTGILSREKYDDPESIAFDATVSFYNGLIDSAQNFGWLATPGNSRIEQLNAGRDWIRLNMAATSLGLAMHPISQVLQEFPEMKTLYDEIHEKLGYGLPARIQGLFRFGYTEFPKAAPRWPLESRLVNG